MDDIIPDKGSTRKNLCPENKGPTEKEPHLDRSVVETIPVAILVTDQSERIVQVNPAAKKLFGASENHLEEVRCGDAIGCIHRKDSPSGCGFGPACPNCNMAGALRDGLAGIRVDGLETEIKIETTGGISNRKVLVSASPFICAGRQSVVIAVQDITEKHELQSKIAQADRLSTMGMLAAGVAHEINNPLCYILYNLESINKDLPDLVKKLGCLRSLLWANASTNPDIQEMSSEILSPVLLGDLMTQFEDALTGARKIREIAHGLSTFSRVEKDQLFPINIQHAIETAISMCYNEIKYRARLVKDYGKTPLITVSEGRLSQVFLNLILNATQAIDEGDVENNEIRVSTRHEEGFVSASVSDTGGGISSEILEKIFDPFFSTKKTGIGSGLGLSISKSIIESYGGAIEVHSNPANGTTFTILIPIETADEKSREDNSTPATDPATKGRVLIVDDEQAIRSAIRRILKKHESVEAEGGAEAKELLQKDRAFDLIICDIMMPEVSGINLHKWLKKTHPKLAERFIFITGGAFTPNAREYLRTNDNLSLEKPFEAANLRKIADELIQSVKK